MTINLELYRVFITVAEKESFTLAAKELGLTQSAVSQAIKQLEGLLDTQLFVRNARGASLTESGEILLGHVGELLNSVNAAQQYFTQLKGLTIGHLRIGASDTLCRHVLLSHLKAFHQTFPGISIQVTNRTSGETASLLRQGVVDIGFVNLPLDGISDLEVHEIMKLHDCFLCSRSYLSMLSPPLSLKELGQYPLLMLERQSASRRFLDQWFWKHNLELNPEIELGSLDLLMDFAQAGLGIAAVPREFAAQRLSEDLEEVPLKESPPPRSVGILIRKRTKPPLAAQALMDMLL